MPPWDAFPFLFKEARSSTQKNRAGSVAPFVPPTFRCTSAKIFCLSGRPHRIRPMKHPEGSDEDEELIVAPEGTGGVQEV